MGLIYGNVLDTGKPLVMGVQFGIDRSERGLIYQLTERIDSAGDGPLQLSSNPTKVSASMRRSRGEG